MYIKLSLYIISFLLLLPGVGPTIYFVTILFLIFVLIGGLNYKCNFPLSGWRLSSLSFIHPIILIRFVLEKKYIDLAPYFIQVFQFFHELKT